MTSGRAVHQTFLADCAYDSDALRQCLQDKGIFANIRGMPNRIKLPVFPKFLYRYRNAVERFFNRLKYFQAIATRYKKHPESYLALAKLASERICLRTYDSMT